MPIPHPLVIFAGGKSSRMGRDKALLPFGDYPTLTQYQIARFHPACDAIYISCKSRNKFDFEADFIEDLPRYSDAAPHIGLISVFEQIDAQTVCALSVDTPFFGAEHFQALLAHDTVDSDAIVARSPRGTQPLCAIYKRTILPHLKTLAAQKAYRFADLFASVRVTFVDFEEEAPFANLNTPAEYRTTLQNLNDKEHSS